MPPTTTITSSTLPDPHADRRTDVRVDVHCPVTIVASGQKRRARIVDLSCGGARIWYESSRMSVPIGAHRVRIEHKGLDPVEMIALPVWRSRFSYGVRFLLVGEVERLAIAEMMDQPMVERKPRRRSRKRKSPSDVAA